MTKEILKAKRDIKKGEELVSIIEAEQGYFHFFDMTGTAYRVKQARNKLTPEQQRERDLEKVKYAQDVAKRRQERAARRAAKEEALVEMRAAKRLEREARIRKKVAALQARL